MKIVWIILLILISTISFACYKLFQEPVMIIKSENMSYPVEMQ